MASFMSDVFEMDSTSYDEELSHLNSMAFVPSPPTHQFQFSEKSEYLVKVSRAIFEDFKSHLASGNDDFKTMLNTFIELCEFGVQSIERLAENRQHEDVNCRLIYSQLTLEYNAYSLMAKLLDENEALPDPNSATSFLAKLYAENMEFRRLLILLRWNEDTAHRNPSGFSAALNDLHQLDNVNNVFAWTTMRGKMAHLDARHDKTVEHEDETNILLLQKLFLALLRCGLLADARRLVQNAGVGAFGAFVYLREFLYNESLSPLEPTDDNYNLAKSRAFAKHTARELIPIDETVSGVDQCVWATLSGSLSTLLTHATSVEDRLWAYVSCAADALLDASMLAAHAVDSDDVMVSYKELAKEDADVPQTVEEIFTQICNNDTNIYYEIFGCLATENWEEAVRRIARHISGGRSMRDVSHAKRRGSTKKTDGSTKKNGGETEHEEANLPAHELRFLTHLVLLFKAAGRLDATAAASTCDELLGSYATLLAEMKLYALIPHYAFHMSADKAKTKMLAFLQGIESVSDQMEVLSAAGEAGFDVGELIRAVYRRYKDKYVIDSSDESAGRAAAQMLRAWRWLSYGGAETIFDALIEANYLLRKMLLHHHIAEAMEMLLIAGENLPAQLEELLGADERSERVAVAQNEFDCYVLYFEAMKNYNVWKKHVEGTSMPELPAKLNDEQWAQLDMRRRDEYCMAVEKARESLQKYMRLSENLKMKALELLEQIVLKKDGWLLARREDEDSVDPELRSRFRDFAVIRDHYFYHVVKNIISVHSRSGDQPAVLDVATLLTDPRHAIDAALSQTHIRKLLAEITKAGVALITNCDGHHSRTSSSVG